MTNMLKAAGAGVLTLALCTSAAFAQDSWWKTAAQPYQGVTIRGISESTPASKYVAEVLGPKFTEETGIKVEFEATSWDQMYDKAIKDMEANTGIYDFVYIEQDIVYTYLARNFLVDITKSLADNSKIASPDFKPENFTTFLNYFKDPKSGDVMGVPMEAFIKPYLYRTDLFGDPEIQKAYKEATGADLKPATTHEEYTRIAKFFTETARTRSCGAPPCRRSPAIRLPSTSSSNRSRRPSASTIGASTAPASRQLSRMAAR